jgi:hypothetical protein
MTIDELITRIDDAKDALQRIDASEEAAVKFSLLRHLRMLRIILDSGDLHQTRRKMARSAYRMGTAALGLDDVA